MFLSPTKHSSTRCLRLEGVPSQGYKENLINSLAAGGESRACDIGTGTDFFSHHSAKAINAVLIYTS